MNLFDLLRMLFRKDGDVIEAEEGELPLKCRRYDVHLSLDRPTGILSPSSIRMKRISL